MVFKRKYSGNKYQCDHCMKSFKFRNTFNYHKKIVHKETSNTCNYCSNSFGSINQLESHIESVHAEVESENCKFCGKDVRFKFSRHIRKCEMVFRRKYSGNKYQCDHCMKSFKFRNTFNYHKKTVHGGASHSESIHKTESTKTENCKEETWLKKFSIFC